MSVDAADPPGPDPDAIAGHSFTRSRKGYEADEVRAYLVALASQLREAQRLHADQARRLAELERRGADPRELDEDQVTQLLGEETARVLDTARKASAEIRAKAKDAADLLTAETDAQATATREAAATYERETRASADDYSAATRRATDDDVDELRTAVAAEVAQLRGEAERILSERTGEAEAAAEVVRSEGDEYRTRVQGEADAYAADIRAEADAYGAEAREAADAYAADARARADADLAAAEAEAESSRAATEKTAAAGRDQAAVEVEKIIEAARQRGRDMVDEARTYRERVIADLADRRRSVRAQLDQLAASRDALAVTLTDVAGRIEASHRALAEAVIDPRDLGDVATDRAALAEPTDLAGPAGEPDEPDAPADADPETADGGTDADAADARDGDDGAGDDPTAAAEAEVAGADTVEEERAPDASAPEELAAEAAVDVNPEPVEDPDAATADVVEGTDEDADADADAGMQASGDDPAAAVFARLKADVDPAVAEASADPEPTVEAKAEDAAPDPDADLLDRRDATVDEIERALARRLKRVLADEQNEALDRLRRVKGQAKSSDVLVSEDDHLQRYLTAALEDLTAAERAGAGFFGEAPEKAADVTDVAHEFATDLVRALRGRLEAAFDDGGDEQEIGERIRACYREWKTQRIAEVATHYVLVAFGRGAAAAGVGGQARWLVDDGDTPCPDCDDNALAGAVPAGDEFPTGDLHPPAHPGCRCIAVPV